MKVALTFTSFSYDGQSIGRDIQVNLTAFDKQILWKKRIRPISTVRADIPIGIFEVADNQNITVEAKVTERDNTFPDSGAGVLTIQSPDIDSEAKDHAITISVSERRFIFWKRTAVFTVGISAYVIQDETFKLQEYASYAGENYNRYDDIFGEVVAYWNNEFSQYGDSPKTLLDPNLMKAMAYQESRVGNDSDNNGLINIMQIGNPGDLSLTTLQGEQHEYWVHNGKLVQLKYPGAKVESVHDSVFWGVRWLYHRAHQNEKNDDGSWRNKWLSWREAVHRYGPGVDEYVENVWKIYTEGTSERKDTTVTLWSFAGTIWLMFLALFGSVISDTDIKEAFAEQFPERKAAFRIDIDVMRNEADRSLFVAVENDGDDWSEGVAVGRIEGRSLRWLPDVPYEVGPANGILGTRFLNLQGFTEPVLEVWSMTHLTNGGIDLYRVTQDALIPIIHIVAHDNYYEDVFQPDGYPEYGGNWYSCSSIYKDKKLEVAYRDTNGDGADEAVLTGVTWTLCKKNPDDEALVLVSEQPIEEVYELTNSKQ